jgi:hypothetical protein
MLQKIKECLGSNTMYQQYTNTPALRITADLNFPWGKNPHERCSYRVTARRLSWPTKYKALIWQFYPRKWNRYRLAAPASNVPTRQQILGRLMVATQETISYPSLQISETFVHPEGAPPVEYPLLTLCKRRGRPLLRVVRGNGSTHTFCLNL